jgi:hypothetical protein
LPAFEPPRLSWSPPPAPRSRTALPELTSVIEKYGDASYHYLLDEIEKRLLTEFGLMMSGSETDRSSIDQAAKILKGANEAMDSLAKMPPDPSVKPTF